MSRDYTAGTPFHAIYRRAIVYQSTRREARFARGAHRAHQLLLMLLIWTRLKGARASLGTGRPIFRSNGARLERDQAFIQAGLKTAPIEI